LIDFINEERKSVFLIINVRFFLILGGSGRRGGGGGGYGGDGGSSYDRSSNVRWYEQYFVFLIILFSFSLAIVAINLVILLVIVHRIVPKLYAITAIKQVTFNSI
jgi:hypothetical protein